MLPDTANFDRRWIRELGSQMGCFHVAPSRGRGIHRHHQPVPARHRGVALQWFRPGRRLHAAQDLHDLLGVVTLAVPLSIVVVQALMVRRPDRLKLRNRDYWLAPERREKTLEFLNVHAMRFAAMLLLFLCVVQWLLVKANAVQPAHLDSRLFITALVGFLIGTVLWLIALYLRFRGRD